MKSVSFFRRPHGSSLSPRATAPPPLCLSSDDLLPPTSSTSPDDLVPALCRAPSHTRGSSHSSPAAMVVAPPPLSPPTAAQVGPLFLLLDLGFRRSHLYLPTPMALEKRRGLGR